MQYENEDARVTAACIYSADIQECWKYAMPKNQIIMCKACHAFLMNAICLAVFKSQCINLHTHSA